MWHQPYQRCKYTTSVDTKNKTKTRYKASHPCRTTCERSESAQRERRIALYKRSSINQSISPEVLQAGALKGLIASQNQFALFEGEKKSFDVRHANAVLTCVSCWCCCCCSWWWWCCCCCCPLLYSIMLNCRYVFKWLTAWCEVGGVYLPCIYLHACQVVVNVD